VSRPPAKFQCGVRLAITRPRVRRPLAVVERRCGYGRQLRAARIRLAAPEGRPPLARCRATPTELAMLAVPSKALLTDDQVTHGARYRISPARAWPSYPAAMCTAMPPMSLQ